MIEANNPIDIDDSTILPFKDKVESLLTEYNFGSKTLSLPQLIQQIDPAESFIMTDCEREMYLTVREGSQIFRAVSSLLSEKTGLKKCLIDAEPDISELNRLRAFCYNFSTYVLSLYIAKKAEALIDAGVSDYKNPDLDILSLAYDMPEESVIKRLMAPLFARLKQHVENRDFFSDPDIFPIYLKTLFQKYAKLALQNSADFSGDLLAHITGYQFRIMDEFLILDGYIDKSARIIRNEVSKPAFQPVAEKDIVGNRTAKQALRRYVDRLALYDPQQMMNPVIELGGLSWSNLFDGPPGTGKTSLFRYVMTRLSELAEKVNIPLSIISIDQSVKDEFYGKTGKILLEKLSVTSDTNALSLVIMDDIDLLTTNRDNAQGADNDVTNILMQYLDGAYTVRRGNVINFAASNKPTGLDDAFRNRFSNRIYIDGPVTSDDFSDMIHIMGGKLLKNNLIQVENGYEPFKSQTTGVIESANDTPDKKAEMLADSFKGYAGATLADFGKYMVSLKQENPGITGRAVRSIMDSVKEQCADFNVPAEWFDEPEIFLTQPYEMKVNLLAGLYKKITPDLLFYEAKRYFDSEQRYMTSEAGSEIDKKFQAMKTDLKAQILFYEDQERSKNAEDFKTTDKTQGTNK